MCVPISGEKVTVNLPELYASFLQRHGFEVVDKTFTGTAVVTDGKIVILANKGRKFVFPVEYIQCKETCKHKPCQGCCHKHS